VYNTESPLRNPFHLLISLFSEMWKFRELTWVIFVRDLKAQYRQSLMGYVWLLVPPVTTTLVWLFLNSQKIIRVETDIPYPLFVFIGITVWTSFVSMVQQPLQGFMGGKAVFVRLQVSPVAFMMANVIRAVFELGLRVTMIVPLFILFKYTPPLTCLLFPFALLFVIVLALALGLLLVPLGSLYGDVQRAVGSFIGLLMYTAPVVYPAPEGDGLLAIIMRYNPLTPGIALCRDLLVNGSLEWLLPALAVSAVATVIMLVGLLVIRVVMPHLIQQMGM